MSFIGAIHSPEFHRVTSPTLPLSPSLSHWQKTHQLFQQIVLHPTFWAISAAASFIFSAVALTGILHVTLIPLIALGSIGILSSGVMIYLYCKKKNTSSLKNINQRIEESTPPSAQDQRPPILVSPINKAGKTKDFEKNLTTSSQRLKVAAHVLGGAGIRQASINDMPLEGSSFSVTAPALLSFLTSTPSRANTHKALIGMLEQLIYFDLLLSKQSTNATTLIPQYIERLIVGQTLTLPGGWQNKAQGHAMIYQIRKDHAEKFTFIVINTGAGCDYHPSKTTYRKEKFAPSIFVSDISKDKILNGLVA